MRQTWFSPEGWAETLYVPPLRNRLLLQTAQAWEQVGIGFSLPFAGLHVVEATKQLYRPGAVRAVRRVAPDVAGLRAGLVPCLAGRPSALRRRRRIDRHFSVILTCRP